MAAVLAPAPAVAQAYQCQVPKGAIALPAPESGEEVRTRVTGYTLAASWSPEYCRTRTPSQADARQCSGKQGRFGMILHGLWPEGADRSPQWCRTERQPGEADLRQNLCATPSVKLLGHEWARHGSCMAQSPAAYFTIQRVLWDNVRWPDFDRLSRRRNLDAGAVRQAIAQANPRWSASQIGLELNPRGWLEGVRLCFNLQFKAVACPKWQLGPGDAAKVSIWRGL
ncbi:ribonuclease T [Altererythrobacter salegens]|uniref:Ribonuclease T n=1 Tax=Croceibacterium salegens TaxID=1737568 RepID=A0A6I4SWN8_9SPHN|nr:ribonuclease T [Croceibacterium salegens]